MFSLEGFVALLLTSGERRLPIWMMASCSILLAAIESNEALQAFARRSRQNLMG
jgi:hypothetical protein